MNYGFLSDLRARTSTLRLNRCTHILAVFYSIKNRRKFNLDVYAYLDVM